LSAATGVIKNTADFSFILKYRHQFVSALEDVELLCTIVSYTGSGTIFFISCLKHRCKYNDSFVAALKDAELLCTVISGIGCQWNSIGTEFRGNFLLSFLQMYSNVLYKVTPPHHNCGNFIFFLVSDTANK
jgi:hypothetical protein